MKESAVVGSVNEKGDEHVKAFIVRKEDSLSQEELIAYCKKNLAPYKIPKEVVFIPEIPKNIIGKALRRLLRLEAQK